MKNTVNTLRKKQGFTIAEIVVTIAVIMVFTAALIQGLMYLSSTSNRSGRDATAINIADKNLAKFNNKSSLPASFNCLTNTTKTNAFHALNDSSANKETPPTGNWGSFTQSVLVYSKRGCNAPITIESIVTYGHPSTIREIVQVGYAL